MMGGNWTYAEVAFNDNPQCGWNNGDCEGGLTRGVLARPRILGKAYMKSRLRGRRSEKDSE